MKVEQKKENKMLVDVKTASGAIRVSPTFLRQLAREKKIPFYRLSERTLRFDLDEVRAYMKLAQEVDHD